ncbi:tetratricopeptide repeat protein [Tannerella forsythia 92A2]|uniref:Tetratricopeptide repeat protein n=2 Tax=Tannerella forsythia TaxID=28112 RepID=G8UN41_TANFA|nr:tetratricopeptide repeat protein [Tannerella forsythia]AEW19848.1 tetratricopeptide repeat protein [Tannerella forsythia 92A2]
MKMKIWSMALGLLLMVGTLRAQTYEEMIRKSYEYADRGDLPAAEEALKAAMHAEPANKNNFALLSNLGTIQRQQGKTDEALVSYTAALSLQPKNKLILSNRAELYVEMGETEKALSDYQALLLLDPLDLDAYYRRGMLYIEAKDYMLADEDFEKIMSIDKESEQGRFGFALLDKARGNYEDSEAILSYLIEKSRTPLQYYEERAELYFRMKKNARAMADLNKIFAETNDVPAHLYVLRGKIKLAQFEKESAAIDFKKALELGYDKAVIDELIKMTF